MGNDIEGRNKNSIELLAENLSIGRELLVSDVISQIGEKTGMNDEGVKKLLPRLRNFQGKVHFENIKSNGRPIGVFIIGVLNGYEKFKYKLLYVKGKYVLG